MTRRIEVPAREARVAEVDAGQLVRVIDVEGGQVGDTWAFVRDAITSCRRVRMVRADWAAVVGGGGAFVIDTLLTDAAAERYYRARLPDISSQCDFRRGQTPPAGEAAAAVVVASASTGPTAAGSAGPTGMTDAGVGVVITGGGAYLASHAATSA